jgi:hypothetical protein
MRFNDLTQIVIILLAGFMLGTIGTLAVYSAVVGRQMEAQRQEAEEAVQRAQEERDAAQAQIDNYVEFERRKRLELEQAGPEAPPQRAEAPPQSEPAAQQPAAVAAKPDAAKPGAAGGTQRRDTAPAPREKGKPAPRPLPEFGPPRYAGH